LRLAIRRGRTDDFAEPWGSLQILVRDGYVLVVNHRVTDVERASAVCRAIDAALTDHGLRRVLLDTRRTESSDEPVRAAMWAWVKTGRNHDRCAIVVESELKRVSGNMTARALGVQLRSFSDLAEAEAWLVGTCAR
jgi:hypothetical protein